MPLTKGGKFGSAGDCAGMTKANSGCDRGNFGRNYSCPHAHAHPSTRSDSKHTQHVPAAFQLVA